MSELTGNHITVKVTLKKTFHKNVNPNDDDGIGLNLTTVNSFCAALIKLIFHHNLNSFPAAFGESLWLHGRNEAFGGLYRVGLD